MSELSAPTPQRRFSGPADPGPDHEQGTAGKPGHAIVHVVSTLRL
ncbi:hypothetical protein OG530_32105 [Streptomyces decoyicus]